MKKQEIHNKLIAVGRDLVIQNGPDFLTARKLSDASKCSVGTIYNQFSNMDKFILEQNMITLDELKQEIANTKSTPDSYKNINLCMEVFVDYVISNSNLWFLLYGFHLKTSYAKLPKKYLKKLLEINMIWEGFFDDIFSKLTKNEKTIAKEVLWISVFSLSALLTTDTLTGLAKINKRNICRLLLNTYLAGLRTLKK